MEKKNFLKPFLQTLLINSLIVGVISLTAFRTDYHGITLILPVVFLLLTAVQQMIKTPVHAVFIALLILLIPLVNFISPAEKTVVFCVFYLFNITAFDLAIRLEKPLPFPDLIPLIFILVARMVSINPRIIYGLVIAYYLARVTTLVLSAITETYEKGDK